MSTKMNVLIALLLVGLYLRPLEAKDNPCKDCKCTEVPWPPECNSCCLKFTGTIMRSNHEVSRLTIRKGNLEKTVDYNSSTKWTTRGKAIDPSELKEGDRVTVLGKRDEKGRFIVTRIDKLPK